MQAETAKTYSSTPFLSQEVFASLGHHREFLNKTLERAFRHLDVVSFREALSVAPEFNVNTYYAATYEQRLRLSHCRGMSSSETAAVIASLIPKGLGTEDRDHNTLPLVAKLASTNDSSKEIQSAFLSFLFQPADTEIFLFSCLSLCRLNNPSFSANIGLIFSFSSDSYIQEFWVPPPCTKSS